MVLRISTPGKPTRLVDLGPHGNGTRAPWKVMRLPIDEAIVLSWLKGHPIRVSR